MTNFLLTFLAGAGLFLSACATDRSVNTDPRDPRVPTAAINETSKSRILDLSELPDRLAAYDDTISGLKKELVLLQDNNASLKLRLDHLEQKASR